ncbi:MAG: hypothetical protein [Siphoviridae sp. ctpQM7]|nr:MAG: hypothetical protein [Siphoviridae sp. ctpQM7]
MTAVKPSNEKFSWHEDARNVNFPPIPYHFSLFRTLKCVDGGIASIACYPPPHIFRLLPPPFLAPG